MTLEGNEIVTDWNCSRWCVLRDCQKLSPVLLIILTSLTSIICLIGALGNALVVVVIYRINLMHKAASILMASLAIIDFFIMIFNFPLWLTVLLQSKWTLGVPFCTLTAFSNTFLSFNSALFVAVISMDRCYAVLLPLKYERKVTQSLVLIVIGGLVGFSSLLSILPLIGFGKYDFVPRYGHCFFGNVKSDISYEIMAVTICYYIPSIIICLSYYKIFTTAKGHTRVVHCDENCCYLVWNTEAKNKLTKTVLFVVGIFFACWLLFFISEAMRLTSLKNISHIMTLLSRWLVYTNSALNPIIYGTTNKNFRSGFKKILTTTLHALPCSQYHH